MLGSEREPKRLQGGTLFRTPRPFPEAAKSWSLGYSAHRKRCKQHSISNLCFLLCLRGQPRGQHSQRLWAPRGALLTRETFGLPGPAQ